MEGTSWSQSKLPTVGGRDELGSVQLPTVGGRDELGSVQLPTAGGRDELGSVQLPTAGGREEEMDNLVSCPLRGDPLLASLSELRYPDAFALNPSELSASVSLRFV